MMRIKKGTVFGKQFTIEGLLYRSSYCRVYKARDRVCSRWAALKLPLVPSHFVREWTLRHFERECEVAMAVRHRGLLKGLAAGSKRNRPFLVTELLQNPTEVEALCTNDPSTCRTLVRHAIDAADAVHALHQAGYIHRDLAPHNLLLHDEQPVAGVSSTNWALKVIDYGTALRLGGDPLEEIERAVAHTGFRCGTPGFIAPEVIAGDSAGSVQSDVWTFGAAIWALAATEYPLHRYPPDVLAHLRRARALQGLSAEIDGAVNGEQRLPLPLLKALNRALETQPADRYGTMAELGDALRAFESQTSRSPPEGN